MPKLARNSIERIIDANINRAKEGLRVCEEITRFILENSRLTSDLKAVRHKIETSLKKLPGRINLLQGRASQTDIGRRIAVNELERKDYRDIFFANIQRVKESLRVLEEFSKLKSALLAVGFKRLRYETYEIEKKVAQKLVSLGRYRQK